MILLTIIYLVLINIVSLFVMYVDKKRAVRHQWRIPERTLFLLAFLGGSVGSILGMYAFRHKTRHWYFVLGMPVILLAQVLIIMIFRMRQQGVIL